MNQIEISATLAKASIDAKKAVITLELEYDSWNQVPNIAKLAGQQVGAILYPAQTSMDLDG